MQPVLVICGPTATGKTSFALEIARRFDGELVSADSRQVYTGMDIVTGKDLPPDSRSKLSELIWRNRRLKYYLMEGIKVWLYDIVNPEESFNVSYWRECADLVIRDIRGRNKLPVVVGGTGLYLKSLFYPLTRMSIPSDPELRRRLSADSADDLFNYLNGLDPASAARMNDSDRQNPRRLVRAIEITRAQSSPSSRLERGVGGGVEDQTDYLQIGLTAPREVLYSGIDRRVEIRLNAGARNEAFGLMQKYSPGLPSMTASGYRAFLEDDFVGAWKTAEHQYARRQLTWFRSQPDIVWFDVSRPGWRAMSFDAVRAWYVKLKT